MASRLYDTTRQPRKVSLALSRFRPSGIASPVVCSPYRRSPSQGWSCPTTA